MEQFALQWNTGPRVLTVSELTAAIGDLLAAEFGTLWVSGEISGCRIPSSGHYYFTLKDKDAQLSAVCYKGTARFLKFKPRDGVAVLARGRLDIWPPQGKYQLVVEALEPQGYGALQFEFEQLKNKLALEGLFAAERKRPLPKLPRRIGLVTSPTGAVIQDMINILSRRFPGLHIRLFPALVQGEGSVDAVCRGIRYFSASGWADVVIVARGGGSLEDLWTFNNESVARAIAASAVPVISAIGHETDFTIADFVADLRAPTPSAAAELVICTREQLLDQIAACRRKLEQAARYRIVQSSRTLHRTGVDRAAAVLHRALARRAQRLDDFDYALRDKSRSLFELRRRGLRALEARLQRRDPRIRVAHSRQRFQDAGHRLRNTFLAALNARAQRLNDLDYALRDKSRSLFELRRRALRALEARLQRSDPRVRVAHSRQRFLEAGHRLQNSARAALNARAQRLNDFDYAIRDKSRSLFELRRRVLRDLETRLQRSDPRVRVAHSRQRFLDAGHRLQNSARAVLNARARRLDSIYARLRRFDPQHALARRRLRLEAAGRALSNALAARRREIQDARHRLQRARASLLQNIKERLAAARGDTDLAAAKLDQLSPLKILERGYAIVQTASGAIVKSPAVAPPGSQIRVRVARGNLDATVNPTPDGSSELPS